MNRLILFVAILFIHNTLLAIVKLPAIFSDNMILQRNAPICIWGSADAGEKIFVYFNKQKKQTVADKDGNWKLLLNKELAGGPYFLKVKSVNDIVQYKNVLVGDVWLCSGQSNMEWELINTLNGDDAVKKSYNNFIRHIKIPHDISTTPLKNIKPTSWQLCNATNSGDFTAVGYFFAKKLQQELNVPIGIINSSWGGTMIETWISKNALLQNNEFSSIAKKLPSTFEQFATEQHARVQKQIRTFQKENKNITLANCEKKEYNDDNWSVMKVPSIWEDQGLPGFDGIVWFRKKFVIDNAEIDKVASLYLGTIDDCDTVYINGVMIGNNCGWDKIRKYNIPKGILQSGENVISVKVLDTGGGGGFNGNAEDLKIVFDNDVLNLSGKWKARIDESSAIVAMPTNGNAMPTLLYNAMIYPLSNFSIKGVIWYQGESNTDRAAQYATCFPMLIKDWRSSFKQPLMPFYFVQLASYNANNQNGTNGSKWAELREAQLKTLSLSNTGMAVTTDIGDAKDIHPKNKKDVGDRLAFLALHDTYGYKIISQGPIFKRMEIAGNKIIIDFKNIGTGLRMSGGNKLNGFLISGTDSVFRPAKASIINNRVIVSREDLNHPVAVRYGWVDDASNANLINTEGFPASPFRTDNWPLLTQGIKYDIGR